ncbi:Type III secretion apparatus [Sodalis praecaptivus]|uniref:Type III secretion apparatus n=1 Tax=Sodalis praecaptivus TaxID=1239307 RepID=W0I155_9GAMM|nr:type III secretion system export apparatus subunit SctT [Sodalis praecaptivus]AHF78183.1 Type III secretion apparatus [Sodalis praecaptivus]
MPLISLFFSFQENSMVIMLAYVRVGTVFLLLPLLGGRILSHLIVKNMVILITLIGIWPDIQPIPDRDQGWVVLIARECVTGLMLAMILSLPFWIASAIGEVIDNQRGATISDSIDPVNGLQSTTMSSFLSFSFGAIFMAQGGMVLLMNALVQSYRVFPSGSSLLGAHWNVAGKLAHLLLENSLILAAPTLITLMLSEIILGVFSRYCPQLNPFSLSLSLKSFIAFTIFMLYGFGAMSAPLMRLFTLTPFYQFIRPAVGG